MLGFVSHADVERVNAEIMTAKKSLPEPNQNRGDDSRRHQAGAEGSVWN